MSNGKRACAVDELPEAGAIQVIIDGDAYAIVRDEDGGIHALEDRCTHAEVALSEGEVEDQDAGPASQPTDEGGAQPVEAVEAGGDAAADTDETKDKDDDK